MGDVTRGVAGLDLRGAHTALPYRPADGPRRAQAQARRQGEQEEQEKKKEPR